jgi:two-component system, LuxR family, response regulator FixJ
VDATVALIDQDAIARARAARVLADSGRVLGFDTARAFFSAAQSQPAQCLVVDAQLEDMTCSQLQAEVLRRGMKVPMVFLIEPGQVELAINLMKGGAADVLVKPIDPDEFNRRVRGVLLAGERARAHVTAARERLGRLTQRELEVVMLATSGLSNKDIADHLSISFRTVEVHRRNAMRKTGTGNIVELTHFVGSAWNDDLNVTEGPQRGEVLTDREREILQLGSNGLTNKAIAARLAISARTVETHRGNASRKADVSGESVTDDLSDAQLSLWGTGEPLRAVGSS